MTVLPRKHTAAIYCRISRDQTGDGEGVERQEALCRELAARLGYEVVAVFRDNDIGASDRTSTRKVREGYQQMLSEAKAGSFSKILAYSNSRLTRRLAELDDFVQLAKDPYNVRVHTVVSGDDDLSTADGLMTARIKASVDAHESDRISERQKAAFQRRALQGKPKLQRQRAFGWKADGVTLEPEEARLIREGVSDVLKGSSITAVARKWQAAGIRTAADGEKWEWSVLQRVLLGWRTAGVMTYRRKPLEGADGNLVRGLWEPIITLDERQAALDMLKKHHIEKKREGSWFLSGLVYCACGEKAYGQLKPKASQNTYGCKKGHVAINADRLEEYVQFSLMAHLTNLELDSGESSVPSEPESYPEEERITVLGDKISELRDAYNANMIAGSIYIPQVSGLNNELEDLKRDRDRWYAERAEPSPVLDSSMPPEEFQKSLLAFMMNLGNADFTELRSLLDRELESVIVKKGQQGSNLRGRSAEEIHRATEERVELVWRQRNHSAVSRPVAV